MDYSRQGDWFVPSKFKHEVHVIGCGALGSFVILQLIKMGVKTIHVYDFDVVEEHNLANQIYDKRHLGKAKVDAITEISHDLCELDQTVIPHNEKVTNQHKSQLRGVVFVLVDSMESRETIWKSCLKYNPNIKLVLEGRMSINFGRVYAFYPHNVKSINAYEKTFYKDEDAEVSMCGSSLSIGATVMQIASIMVWKLIKYHLDKPFYNEILLDMEHMNLLTTTWG